MTRLALRAVRLSGLFSRLRVTLVSLVLLAVLPALGLVMYTAFEHQQMAAVEAQTDALRMARIAAADQNRLIQETHQLLSNLAELPYIRGANADACNAGLALMLTQRTAYANLGVIKPNGDVFCSAVAVTEPVNVAEWEHFRRGLEQHDFATPDLQVASSTGRTTLTFGRPVLDEAGELQVVVFAALDLSWLDELASHAQLPPGSALGLMNRNGTILAQEPDPEKWVGRYLFDLSPVQNTLGAGEASAEARGPDGVLRLYAFAPVHGTSPDTAVYVWSGVPKEAAVADATRILRRNVIILGLVAVLALAAAWLGTDVLIVRRVATLVRVTQRLSAGDRTARTGVRYGPGELAYLAHAVDEMAESLQHHDDRSQRQLETLRTLHEIDTAIASSLNLHSTLDLFLDRVLALVHADAADVLLLHAPTQRLEYAAGRGFQHGAVRDRQVPFGEGIAGRAAKERCSLGVSNPAALESSSVQARLLSDEGFMSHHVVPLVAKGRLEGVLEVFWRTPFEPSSEWRDTAQLLAGQAAIAIDNAVLFDDMRHSREELALAYDTTLEGWSRALDMRDKETEGHSMRVTEMTLRLARALGIPDDELVHVRRGALLHDIGKIAIPDDILLKPGPLTTEEWDIMRRHPVYAYELLSPIEYLRPALDIPYCHHEKWDGTGYPRGLRGKQIPLAARVFAVVDVWDALRSDRPYRLAWSADKVREHIHSLKGVHFDAQVVDVFLQGHYYDEVRGNGKKQRMGDPGEWEIRLHR